MRITNRRIAGPLFAVMVVAVLLLAGCSRGAATGNTPPAKQEPPPKAITPANYPGLTFIQNGSQTGSGPLTKGNVTIGGIYLGESQQQVSTQLGQPNKVTTARGTPFPEWYYAKNNMYVDFYATGAPDGTGGVDGISIVDPSAIQTNTGIGIGDTLDKISKIYPRMYAIKATNDNSVVNIWITGQNSFVLSNQAGKRGVFYYPTLNFVLQNGRVAYFSLSNMEQKP